MREKNGFCARTRPRRSDELPQALKRKLVLANGWHDRGRALPESQSPTVRKSCGSSQIQAVRFPNPASALPKIQPVRVLGRSGELPQALKRKLVLANGWHDRGRALPKPKSSRCISQIQSVLPPARGLRNGTEALWSDRQQFVDLTLRDEVSRLANLYQTWQAFSGAMGCPVLQLNALRNSGKLETTPLTRH